MTCWTSFRGAEGKDVLVDADRALAVTPAGDGAEIWMLGRDKVQVKHPASYVRDMLDLPSLTGGCNFQGA